jgi:tRNA(Ile)-lysidine synthase
MTGFFFASSFPRDDINMPLLSSFISLLQQYPNTNRFFLAYSGGLDSQVLLHLAHRAREALSTQKFSALHINHGLSLKADAWATHCAQSCQRLAIPLQVIPINAKAAKGMSREAVAREARYAALSRYLTAQDCLLTAHHQDDQAETVLLQLLRGAGVKGLAAIPLQRPLGPGLLVRPLLKFTRAELQAYAKTHDLTWVEDESNRDTSLDRNFIRHHLMPLLKSRNPKATAQLARAAMHCGQAQGLLDQLAAQDLSACYGSQPHTLAISKLMTHASARRHNIVRYWLTELGLPLPDTKALNKITQEVLLCKPDANPKLCWRGVEIRRFRDDLYAMAPLTPLDPCLVIDWHVAKSPTLVLPNQLGVLKAQPPVVPVHLQIRFRQGGERSLFPGEARARRVKGLMQQKCVPPWLRARALYLYHQTELLAILGEGVADKLEVVFATKPLVIEWVKQSELSKSIFF